MARPSWISFGSWETPCTAIRSPPAWSTSTLIRPDGTQPTYDPIAGGFTGGGLVDSVWGLNVDGNDDVWVANIGPVQNGVVLMAGVDTKGHPAGTKTGDVVYYGVAAFNFLPIHRSTRPATYGPRTIGISHSVALAVDPVRRTSTWGCGSNFTVIYGVAAPVKPPKMGKVRPY